MGSNVKTSQKLSVVKNSDSPTGYWIHSGSGGAGVPATIYEIRLWNMYLEMLELTHRLQHKIDVLSAKEEADSEEKGNG